MIRTILPPANAVPSTGRSPGSRQSSGGTAAGSTITPMRLAPPTNGVPLGPSGGRGMPSHVKRGSAPLAPRGMSCQNLAASEGVTKAR